MPIQAAFIVPHPPLIVPEVGRGQEEGIAKTTVGFREAASRIARLRPDTIVLFSPHSISYADYIHISPGEGAKGSLAHFGAPAVTEAVYDSGLARALSARCDEAGIPAGTLGERDKSLDHGTLVPLYFVNKAYKGYKLVRTGLSGLSREAHYRFGMLLRDTVEELGRDVIVIASGDLSHKLKEDGPYGFVPEGPQLDKALTDIMRSGDFGGFLTLPDSLSAAGADCGLLSFIMMAGALDRTAVIPELLSYEGPFGVGYAVAAFSVTGRDDSRNFLDQYKSEEARAVAERRGKESPYVRLARSILEGHIRTGKTPPLPDGLPGDMTSSRAGVFVSIKKRGQLRGCIGTITPTKSSIAEEIRRNAVSAGTDDPRFPPITEEELGELTYSVDILSPAEPATMESLDPVRYGVIVSSGYRRGLLLPNLEGVDTAAQQVAIALQKAGIGGSEDYKLERFEVVRHL